jgi:hypothetical protein
VADNPGESATKEEPMDEPLDSEAATADLITDIVASSHDRWLPDLELCDVAHSVTSGSEGWRDAWSLSSDRVPREPDSGFDDGQGLTREEDDELRHLFWLSQIASLAGRKAERFIELRLRDRRRDVRPPREDEPVGSPAGDKRRWLRFRSH